jgi:hypothetical protein
MGERVRGWRSASLEVGGRRKDDRRQRAEDRRQLGTKNPFDRLRTSKHWAQRDDAEAEGRFVLRTPTLRAGSRFEIVDCRIKGFRCQEKKHSA